MLQLPLGESWLVVARLEALVSVPVAVTATWWRAGVFFPVRDKGVCFGVIFFDGLGFRWVFFFSVLSDTDLPWVLFLECLSYVFVRL